MWELLAAVDPPSDPWLFTFFQNSPLQFRLWVVFAFGVMVGRGMTWLFPRFDLPDNIWIDETETGYADGLWPNFPLFGFFFRRCATSRDRVRRRAILAVELATGLLFAGLVYMVTEEKGQSTPEEGSGFYIHWRLMFQFLLLALLIAATTIDLELYLIPDSITLTGALAGVAIATAVGYLQLVPLWVDWNLAEPGLSGAYIPKWIQHHAHLHGIAWSLAGLVVGAGMTWIVRAVASLVLGQEALGLGDVTLMGMIGCYLGWQAMVFVFLLAPLCGIVVGLAVRMFTGRTYVPYGPYLSVAAVAVLYSWKWLWEPTRTVFGDWITLAILGAVSLVGLVVLLGLSRLYWMIPVSRPVEESSPDRIDVEAEQEEKVEEEDNVCDDVDVGFDEPETGCDEAESQPGESI